MPKSKDEFLKQQKPAPRSPMQGKRRVHAYGQFAPIYSIRESDNTVIIEDYARQDNIYG